MPNKARLQVIRRRLSRLTFAFWTVSVSILFLTVAAVFVIYNFFPGMIGGFLSTGIVASALYSVLSWFYWYVAAKPDLADELKASVVRALVDDGVALSEMLKHVDIYDK